MPMVRAFVVAFSMLTAPAFAGSYVVQCSTPCTASDGTTQPAGTAVNRILADPGFDPGPGLALAPDTGQSVYAPPAPVPTSLTASAFIARFTPAEQNAMATAAQTNPQILLLLIRLSAAQSINASDPTVIGGVNAMAAAGLLTQARAAQVLNYSKASP